MCIRQSQMEKLLDIDSKAKIAWGEKEKIAWGDKKRRETPWLWRFIAGASVIAQW